MNSFRIPGAFKVRRGCCRLSAHGSHGQWSGPLGGRAGESLRRVRTVRQERVARRRYHHLPFSLLINFIPTLHANESLSLLTAGGFGLGLWISRHIVQMHQVGQGVLSGKKCYLASHHSFRRGVWASLLQVAASDPLSSSRCQCTGRISVRPMMISCSCRRVVPGHTQHLWSHCHCTIIRCHCPTIPAKHCHTML